MKFAFEKEIRAPLDLVEEASVDAEYLGELARLGQLDGVEMLEQHRDEGTVRQRVRYRYRGPIPGAAKRLMPSGGLTWIEESVVDFDDHSSRFEILTEHHGGMLQCAGTSRLERRNDCTVRTISGDVHVRAPLIGRVIERFIVESVRKELSNAAQLLATRAAEAHQGDHLAT